MQQHRRKVAPLRADARNEEGDRWCDLAKLRHSVRCGRTRYEANPPFTGFGARCCPTSDSKIKRLFWGRSISHHP
jgi:hypothetical protein